jgi:hypothetical protein
LRFRVFEAGADFRDAVFSPRRDDAELLVRAAAARGLGRATDRLAVFATGRVVRARDTAVRVGEAAFDVAGLAAAGSCVSAAVRPFPSAGCGARRTGVKRI